MSVRLGMVGCGWISEWHARAAAATSGVDMVACCDVREESARKFADEFSLERWYPDLGQMLREHELDAVVLATWPVDHRDHLLQCLEGGIRWILCEKSLAPGSKEAIEIWKAARDAGAVIVEGLMWRHHPAIGMIDDLIARGDLGDLQYVRTQFDFFVPETASADDPNRNWRQRADAGGGVPWDVTCYCVDACNRFAGALPVAVSASTDRSAKYGTVDRLHGWIEYADGTNGMVSTSFRSNGNYELQVNGTKASVEVLNAWRIDGPSRVDLRWSTGLFEWAEESSSVAEADPYQIQLERFVKHIGGAAFPEPALAETVVNACTIDALLQSGAEREPVAVDIPAEVRDSLRGATSEAAPTG